MLGTVLLVGMGLLIIVLCIQGLNANRQRRVDRRTSAPDEVGVRERAEAWRLASRDIEKGKIYGSGGVDASGGGFGGF